MSRNRDQPVINTKRIAQIGVGRVTGKNIVEKIFLFFFFPPSPGMHKDRDEKLLTLAVERSDRNKHRKFNIRKTAFVKISNFK